MKFLARHSPTLLRITALCGAFALQITQQHNYIAPFSALQLLIWLIVPGESLARLLKLNLSGAVKVFFVPVMSIFFIIAESYLVNLVCHWVVHAATFSGHIYQISTLVIGVVLVIASAFVQAPAKLALPKFHKALWWLVPSIVTAIACLVGIAILNNGGSNMLLVGSIVANLIYLIALYALPSRRRAFVLLTGAMIFGVLLLLTFSLRSAYISGPDISYEYKIAELTAHNGFWSIASLRHAYNACLSVAMLPVSLQQLGSVSISFVFKFMNPVIFMWSALGVYLIARRYFSGLQANVATVMYVAYTAASIDFVTITRQSVALLFFVGTLFIVLGGNKYHSRGWRGLFLLLALGMIVSHYSTTYVALILFAGIWITALVKKQFSKAHAITLPTVNGKVLLSLFLITFLWWGQITASDNNIVSFVKDSAGNITNLFASDIRDSNASVVSQFSYHSGDPVAALDAYTKQTAQSYGPSNGEVTDKDYKAAPLPSDAMAARLPGAAMSLVSLASRAAAIAMKVFMILGVLAIIIGRRRRSALQGLAITSLILMIAITVLPLASLDYDMERLFNQVLSILVIGWMLTATFLVSRLRLLGKTVVVGTLLLFCVANSGILSQLIGGGTFNMRFSNSGVNYDRFYTHTSEVQEAAWMNTHVPATSDIFSDPDAKAKLSAYSAFSTTQIRNTILPFTILPGSYIYTSETNFLQQKAYVRSLGVTVPYDFPTDYLQTKNTVYSNGNTAIYH